MSSRSDPGAVFGQFGKAETGRASLQEGLGLGGWRSCHGASCLQHRVCMGPGDFTPWVRGRKAQLCCRQIPLLAQIPESLGHLIFFPVSWKLLSDCSSRRFRKHVSRPYLQFPCKKEKRGEGGRISCRGNAACWRKSNLPRERGAAAEETCEICPLSASSAAPVGARPAVKRWALIVRGIHGKAGIRPRNKTSTGETSHLLRDLFSLRSCSG